MSKSRESSFRRRIRVSGSSDSRSGKSRGGYNRRSSRGYSSYSGESRSSGESR